MITSEEKTTLESENTLVVTITNGDVAVVKELVDGYGFKDVGSFFAFAIGATVEGYNKEGLFTIVVDSEGNKKLKTIKPKQELLNSEAE